VKVALLPVSSCSFLGNLVKSGLLRRVGVEALLLDESVSLHLGVGLSNSSHLRGLGVSHLLGFIVLGLLSLSFILSKDVGDESRDGSLWVVGSTVSEVVAGELVGFLSDHTEGNTGVIVLSVSPVSLHSVKKKTFQ
jgi:hypothetical protein